MLQTTSISQHNLNSITEHSQLNLFSIIHKNEKKREKKTSHYLIIVE